MHEVLDMDYLRNYVLQHLINFNTPNQTCKNQTCKVPNGQQLPAGLFFALKEYYYTAPKITTECSRIYPSTGKSKVRPWILFRH